MRKILALGTLMAALYMAPPASAAKKPKLPSACVDALRKADVLSVVQLETARAGAQVSIAAGPFVLGNPAANANTYVAALADMESAGKNLTAILDSGDAARDAYERAARKCRSATR